MRAYRPGCSIETAHQLLLDRIYSTADESRPILLMSLDMSAAFDTIDHTVLLKRLSCSFGVAGNVHSWIHSYLTGRTQSVRIGSHSSPPSSCSIGVPQGSVLGLLLFSIYVHFTHFYHCSLTQSLSTCTGQSRGKPALPSSILF